MTFIYTEISFCVTSRQYQLHIYYVSPKKNLKYFSFIYVLQVVYVIVFQLSLKLLFCDILKMIRDIGFKSGNIIFYKQKNQPAKYQHLGIASLRGTVITLLEKNSLKKFRERNYVPT